MIIFGPLLVLVVLFAPGGVLGLAAKMQQLLKGRGGAS